MLYRLISTCHGQVRSSASLDPIFTTPPKFPAFPQKVQGSETGPCGVDVFAPLGIVVAKPKTRKLRLKKEIFNSLGSWLSEKYKTTQC